MTEPEAEFEDDSRHYVIYAVDDYRRVLEWRMRNRLEYWRSLAKEPLSARVDLESTLALDSVMRAINITVKTGRFKFAWQLAGSVLDGRLKPAGTAERMCELIDRWLDPYFPGGPNDPDTEPPG